MKATRRGGWTKQGNLSPRLVHSLKPMAFSLAPTTTTERASVKRQLSNILDRFWLKLSHAIEENAHPFSVQQGGAVDFERTSQIPQLAFNCRVNSATNPEKIDASICPQKTYDEK